MVQNFDLTRAETPSTDRRLSYDAEAELAGQCSFKSLPIEGPQKEIRCNSETLIVGV